MIQDAKIPGPARRWFAAKKQELCQLLAGRPGHRFAEHRQRRDNSGTSGSGEIAIAVGLIILGLAIGWLPGPGGVVAVLGVGMLTSHSATLARFLDRAESRLTRCLPRRFRISQTDG